MLLRRYARLAGIPGGRKGQVAYAGGKVGPIQDDWPADPCERRRRQLVRAQPVAGAAPELARTRARPSTRLLAKAVFLLASTTRSCAHFLAMASRQPSDFAVVPEATSLQAAADTAVSTVHGLPNSVVTVDEASAAEAVSAPKAAPTEKRKGIFMAVLRPARTCELDIDLKAGRILSRMMKHQGSWLALP
jgi:hypothetical protein